MTCQESRRFVILARLSASATRAEDASILLRTGRTDMAAVLLKGLPQQIRDALSAAYEAGGEDAERIRTALSEALQRAAALELEVARLKREVVRLNTPPAVRQLPTNASGLAQALIDGRITVARVAELLNIRPEDVRPLAEGRVGLAPSAWKRLLTEIAA